MRGPVGLVADFGHDGDASALRGGAESAPIALTAAVGALGRFCDEPMEIYNAAAKDRGPFCRRVGFLWGRWSRAQARSRRMSLGHQRE